MKKLILLALTSLIMMGCSEETEKIPFKVLQVDSCEYIGIAGHYGFAHKGNCRFCKERRQKELEELAAKLKEK